MKTVVQRGGSILKNSDIFSVKIGGQAGQGIKSAGLMLAKFATRSGYNIYTYTEYPSLIRGGHNVMQINISSQEVLAPQKYIDFLIALNQQTIDQHLDELTPGSAILFDGEDGLDVSKVNSEIGRYPIPLSKLAADAGGKELLSNSVALGAVVAFLGGDLIVLQEITSEEFADKDPQVVQTNRQAVQLGYNFATQNFASSIKKILQPIPNADLKIIVNGNEAVALGAIAAGLQLAAIYPMTPITSILHILALHQQEYGYIYKQPEDEISAINMAIGASFAGVRAMTATSGGGFCLMTEGLGLAGMTETPLVVILGMRAGPATGMPTWSEQGDLQFVLHAAHGDFPRIVLAPGNGKEAFFQTRQAFNLADKYQTPVIILVDKNLCENDQSFAIFDTFSFEYDRGKFTLFVTPNYQRYSLQADGISSRTIPGVGNFFIANSDEHNQTGFSSDKVGDRHTQMAKRMTKLETCAREDMPTPQLVGPQGADLTIVSWGSSQGAILEALKNFDNVNFLPISWMSPFPAQEVKNILGKARRVLDIECNYPGQLASLIREKTGLEIADKMLKFDGRPFYSEEIVDKIKEVLKI